MKFVHQHSTGLQIPTWKIDLFTFFVGLALVLAGVYVIFGSGAVMIAVGAFLMWVAMLPNGQRK